MGTLKRSTCKGCGSEWHTFWKCPYKERKLTLYKPRKPLRTESVKSRRKRTITYKQWIKLNPPDEYGMWDCYLQISTMCPMRLTRQLLTLEHVYPKVKRPDLKYEPRNIKSACAFCNKMKGSRTIDKLAKSFIHIAIMVQTPEWKAWEQSLALTVS